MSKEHPIVAACPNCKRLHEDLDGFGVLYCEHCKWCSHASISGGQCDFCNQAQFDAEEDGPMDLEDQLDAALDAAFPAAK